jgi:hypothetical protein
VKVTRRSLGKGEVEVVSEFHFWDKPAALNLLGKYHKLLTEKVEIQNTNGEKSKQEISRLSDAELRAELIRVNKLRIQEAQDELERLEAS